MWKEIIIIIVILLIVLTLNYITQKYTEFCVSEVSSDLNRLREKLKNQIEGEELPKELNSSINNIHDKWDKMYWTVPVISKYSSVETCLTNIRSNIETKELEHSIENLDNCIFILEHIKDKENLSLANIF